MTGAATQPVTAEALTKTGRERGLPEIDASRCAGCGRCALLCRKLGPDVLEVVEGVARVVRPENCTCDGVCAMACRFRAISLAGTDSTTPSTRAV